MKPTKPILICGSILALACSLALGAGSVTPSSSPTMDSLPSTQTPIPSATWVSVPATEFSFEEPVMIVGGFGNPGDDASCRERIDSYLATIDALHLPVSPIASDTAQQATEIAPPFSSYPGTADQVFDSDRLDIYALEAGDYLMQHEQDGIDGLREWLTSQNLLCETSSCPNSVAAANLDEDEALEYVVALSEPGSGLSRCGTWEHTTIVYILNCSQNFCQIYRLDRSRGRDNPDRGTSCIAGVADINQDDQPEVLITLQISGASDYYSFLDIVSWDGFRYRYLTPPLTVHNGCILGRKQANTEQMEIITFSSNMGGSAGMNAGSGPIPPDVLTYQWDGRSYTLTGRAFGLGCSFEVIWAGRSWAHRGEIETALAFFKEVVNNETLQSCAYGFGHFDTQSQTEFPWRGYAQFAIGVLEARMGRADEARAALNRVRDLDNPGIYTRAVEVFLSAYGDGSYASACEALSAYVNGLPDDNLFRGPYPASQLSTMCPPELP